MQLELRSVRIKNCGPIDDVKLDFFDAAGQTLPVCVIGGANGSGKTTLMEVIVSLAEMLASHNPSGLLLKPDAYAQTDWRVDNTEFSVFCGQMPDDATLQTEYYGRKRSDEGSVEKQISPTLAILSDRIGQQDGEPTHDYVASVTDRVPSLIYLPHNRSLEPIRGQEVRREADLYRFVHRFQTVRQFPGSLTSYLIWLDYAEPDRFAQAKQFLNDLDFDGKTFRVDRKSLNVLVKTANAQEHTLHELSSGEQNLLIILVELRRKLIPGSVVLIDEIENSLHPAYQHRLAQGLLALQREIPFQLIVTTHARTFVEIFGPEHTLLLTPF